MRKKSILIVLISVIGASSFAQIVQTTGGNVQYDAETWLARNSLRKFNENEGVVGDRYLYSEWVDGMVKTTDSITLKSVPLKYDLVEDYLIAKVNGANMVLINKNLKNFSMLKNGRKQSFVPLELNGKTGLYESLHQGKSNLYLKHSTKRVEKDGGNQAYGSGIAYDKFVYSSEYYAQLPGGEVEKFKNRKGWIVKYMGDGMGEYIKSEKLDLKENADLIKLFEYYDSINE